MYNRMCRIFKILVYNSFFKGLSYPHSRETQREREKLMQERNTDQLPPAWAPSANQCCHLGMRPHWELNQ